jgi:hypothetical protein
MISGEKSAIISKKDAFSEVVDEACNRLQDRQIQYSLKRLREMEENLNGLERELDEFLLHKNGSR